MQTNSSENDKKLKWNLTLKAAERPREASNNSGNPYIDSLHQVGLKEFSRTRIKWKELHGLKVQDKLQQK